MDLGAPREPFMPQAGCRVCWPKWAVTRIIQHYPSNYIWLLQALITSFCTFWKNFEGLKKFANYWWNLNLLINPSGPHLYQPGVRTWIRVCVLGRGAFPQGQAHGHLPQDTSWRQDHLQDWRRRSRALVHVGKSVPGPEWGIYSTWGCFRDQLEGPVFVYFAPIVGRCSLSLRFCRHFSQETILNMEIPRSMWWFPASRGLNKFILL